MDRALVKHEHDERQHAREAADQNREFALRILLPRAPARPRVRARPRPRARRREFLVRRRRGV